MTLGANRASGTDEADNASPLLVIHHKKAPPIGNSECEKTTFTDRMIRIVKGYREWITEYCRSLLKCDPVFARICQSFLGIPLELHTFIVRGCLRARLSSRKP